MTTELQDLEQQKALDHIRELLSAHWHEAEGAADDDGKFAVAFKATFDRGAQPTKLKVTCRIAKTISDEIESENRRSAPAEIAVSNARRRHCARLHCRR